MKQPQTNSPVPYRDLPFRIIISVIAAHFIVIYGDRQPLAELLLSIQYYIAIAGSTVIAFVLISTVWFATTRLDSRYDWKELPLSRIPLQLLLGLVVPSLIAYLMAALYFWSLGVSILNRAYLRYDFPVIIILLLLLNLYYICYYFYLQMRMAEQQLLHVPAREADATNTKNSFLIQSGTKNIPLPVEQIAIFYRDSPHNFIVEFSGKTHLISQALDEIEQLTSPQQFFRANRQVIVSYQACRDYELLAYGKLQLFTEPSLKPAIIISQRRAVEFKRWMDR